MVSNQTLICKSMAHHRCFDARADINEGEKIIRPQLRELNQIQETEGKFVDIVNLEYGFKWSSKHRLGNYKIKPVFSSISQSKWIICSRDGILMFGLCPPNSQHSYYFAVKSGPYLRLDSTLRRCNVNATKEDWHFVMSNSRNNIQHCKTKEYVKLDTRDYADTLETKLVFTRVPEEATDWTFVEN